MRSISRRHMLKLSAASAAVVAIQGCTEDQVRKFALVAIVVGGITLKFGEPALRVLGVTLIVAGHLVVEYLNQDGDQIKQIFDLTKEMVDTLIKERKITLKREDGKEEFFPIGEVDYGPNAKDK